METGNRNVEVVYVDPEPPDPAGGGIRTCLRLSLQACREQGIATRIYTHNPEAYSGENVSPIGRKAWLRRPWRGLAYRLLYAENVLWEHAHWLGAELEATDSPGKVYEFADFLGYAYFALKNPGLNGRIIVRLHTPNFLVNGPPEGLWPRIVHGFGVRREMTCLDQARNITVPSAEFVHEKLPGLRNWTHIPNPLPPESAADIESSGGSGGRNFLRGPARFLYLGRVETRKGVLPMVRAFIRLAAVRPEVSLTLVGGAVAGPYAESVRALIDSQSPEMKSRLTWEPPCTAADRPALLSRFNTLVVPSLWENSPYVYFEGMAAGLLCIGSATGEMKAVAGITGSPMAIPGDEKDWLRVMDEVASGTGRDALPAQIAYLRERRREIRIRLLDHYRGLAEK